MKIGAYLFLDEDFKEEKNIREWILKPESHPGMYVLILQEEPSFKLEIMLASFLLHNHLKGKGRIIGAGKTYEGMLELVRKMTEDAFCIFHRVDLKAYIEMMEEGAGTE